MSKNASIVMILVSLLGIFGVVGGIETSGPSNALAFSKYLMLLVVFFVMCLMGFSFYTEAKERE